MVMTANENNRRYLAEAWIDEDKDEEFKKSFLENLLNQLEHHKTDRTGFDADMLDGKHYCQISQEIDEKVEGLLKDFSIGNVYISNENGSNYILGFDAIKLFANPEYSDGYTPKDKTLPWDDTPRTTQTTLMQVFEELYEKVAAKVDQNQYDTEVGAIESKVDALEEVAETVSNSFNDDGSLNATTVNGIQFYILSETAYSQVPQSQKDDITNVFIVKPDTEISSILDEDGNPKYPKGRVTRNSDIAEISSYYEFRIAVKIDEDTGESQKWLQYRYEGSAPERKDGETDDEWRARDEATWKDVDLAANFIDIETVENLIRNYMQAGNYSLNPAIIKEAFNKIGRSGSGVDGFTKFDSESGPVQFLLDNFISGVKYNNEKNPNEVLINLPNEGTSKYVDLDVIVNKIETAVNNRFEEYWKTIYPVGSIYITENAFFSPQETFGGRWERIKGRFLIGADDTSTYHCGATGGEKEVRLETGHMPPHQHTLSHQHRIHPTSSFLYSSLNIGVNSVERAWPAPKKGGTNFVVNVDTNKKGGIGEKDKTENATVTTTTATGGHKPHNNMPPYYGVNIWRRIE